MHIDAIEIHHVGLPLKRRLPGPASRYERLETVLVRLQSGQLSGWGEASPGTGPMMSGEWAAGALACLRDWLAPAIQGLSIDTGDELTQKLDFVRGNRFAKGALDMAWWDLRARIDGRPLHQALGATRPAFEVGITLDQMDSPDEFIATLQQAFAAGFARAKLKFRPGWEIRMIEAVRRECPIEALSIDVEGGLTLGHSDILYRLDDFHLAMVEQPLWADELVGHAMVQEMIRTPVCLDESITTVAHAEIAFDLKSCKYINLKPGRVGGLTSAQAIYELAHENCTPCYVGAMPQSAIGARFGYALAARDNCVFPADYFDAAQYLEADLAPPLAPARDPTDGVQRITLWTAPGIGVEPDVQALERFRIAHAKL